MFVMNTPFFDLDQIYESGQGLRWKKLKDKKYIIIHQGASLKIEQKKDRLIMSCSEEEFYSIWFSYFDFGTDYSEINYSTRRLEEEFKIFSVRAKGVRIIKRDLFEVAVASVVYGNIGGKYVKSKLDLLSVMCGEEHIQAMGEVGKVRWYEFPSPEEILSKEDRLKTYNVNFSYKLNMILQLCQDILEGWLDLTSLEGMTYEEIKEYLMQFEYFTKESVDYLCIYALQFTDIFLLNLNTQSAVKELLGCDLQTFQDWYSEDIDGTESIVVQYLIYNYLNPIKKREYKEWLE